MLSQQGHFTLGHATGTMNVLTTRVELNKALGVDSVILSPPEIKKHGGDEPLPSMRAPWQNHQENLPMISMSWRPP